MRRSTAAIITALALSLPALAEATPLEHRGFMARLGLGVGYLASTEGTPVGDFSLYGVAGSTQLALGGYVIPNLAIHATIWGGTAFGPNVSYGSSTSTTSTDASLTAASLGAGVTYFLPGIDLFFSGSLGLSTLSFEYRRGSTTYTASTRAGFGMNLTAGWQGALGPDWGLGAAVQFGFQSNPDEAGSTSYTINTLHLGLLLNVSYH